MAQQNSEKKKFPLGESFFKNIIEDHYYFIDKSLFIHNVIESGSKILLFPRPRRFGKTCNISMLRFFFENSQPSNAHLFEGLAIRSQSTWKHQGQYPVINISLKNVHGRTWKKCFNLLTHELSDEFNRHSYVLDTTILSPHEKADYEAILQRKADETVCAFALKNLSQYLSKFYSQQVIILCDEYDTPIHDGFLHHYYDNVIDFMRLFFGSAFKDNNVLFKGVLTGILRLARESIFSELNNVDVYSTLRDSFSQFFGITSKEVNQLLHEYHLTQYQEAISREYNGYQFGRYTIYNPWSLLHFCDDPDAGTLPYWINTSGNALIRQLIFEQQLLKVSDIKALIDGQMIWKKISENLVMKDLNRFRDAVWNLLLFSGYLTICKQSSEITDSQKSICCLKIPNEEIKHYFSAEMEKLTARQNVKTLMTLENKTIKTLFISYNHEDQPFVQQLKTDLEKADIQLIIDIDHMKFGDNIQEYIERSVKESDLTLSVISDNSLKSPWVILETLETFQQENFNKSLRYLPVVIDSNFQTPSFASKLIDNIEKSIDIIVEEIARLSKKYVPTDSLDIQKKRLITLRSNIDHVLYQLSERLVADFTSPLKYVENFPRLIQSIKQV